MLHTAVCKDRELLSASVLNTRLNTQWRQMCERRETISTRGEKKLWRSVVLAGMLTSRAWGNEGKPHSAKATTSRLETQAGRLRMKAGSKRRAEQTEGVLSGAELKRMAGMKERQRPREEDRNEHLVGRSKDGSFKSSTSASPGSCCSLWNRQPERSPRIKANHLQ